jgi:hypothetical protein
MQRLHRKGFWRVESERWSHDFEDSEYQGTETFQGGQSEPFATKKAAIKSALEHLERGDWVKVEHYPSPFDASTQ